MSNVASLAVRRLWSEVEPWTGWLASLRVPGYTEDPVTVGRADGVYRADDWSVARQRDLRWSDDDTYRRHIYGVEGDNVIAAISLAQVFDFSRYRSIWEIGCGDMAQAYVLHRLYPDIRYVATDLDPWVIQRCRALSVLDGIDKRVLDVLALPENQAPFAGFDLLMSWGMEYALDDAQLLRLLRMVRRYEMPYLLCSATTTGFGKYLRHLLRTPRRAQLAKTHRLRLTGWERSPLRFYRLARRAGLTMRVIGRFGYHYCMLLEPAERRANGVSSGSA